eukprot:COSAG06_NODE_56200_length_286_cov_0.545455_1_plen_39_part_01
MKLSFIEWYYNININNDLNVIKYLVIWCEKRLFGAVMHW